MIGTPAAKSTPAVTSTLVSQYIQETSSVKQIFSTYVINLEHAPVPTSDSDDDSEDSEIETKTPIQNKKSTDKKDPVKRKLSECLDKESSDDNVSVYLYFSILQVT